MQRITALAWALAATAFLLSIGEPVLAQEYPTKAVRIVVPFAPCGPNDLAVRPVAQKLYEFLGHPFVIDYRAGANGIIGCDMVHVPYKGVSLALTDVIGGHVDSMFISAPGAIAQVKAGKVRVLAVASARRARSLPEVPTFTEAG